MSSPGVRSSVTMNEGTGTLVFFSSQYPSELTIANELAVIAPHFERVLYLPTTIRSVQSIAATSLPPNVEMVDVMARDDGRLRAGDYPGLLSLMASAMRRPESSRAYRRHPRTYAAIAVDQFGRARVLERFIRARDLGNALFYDYWFENVTLALALLKRRGVIRRCFARAHRFDLYDAPAEDWVVPFRAFKAQQLDRIIPISEDGADYLRAKLPAGIHWKIKVSRLGVPDATPVPARSDPPLVVSCSHMKPFKQVQMIPTLLAQVGSPLRWVHFGDGPLLEETKRRAHALPSRVLWELRGDVPHPDVLRFFRETPVSLFLSLSVSEGIPVSMMEALSFGVPVMAYAVCGIPELVTQETGVSLKTDWPIEKIGTLLRQSLAPGAFDPSAIVRFQRRRFSMHRNYEAFVRLIEQI
jgi:glycosyltransferase involved in cell wall biosynthesis